MNMSDPIIIIGMHRSGTSMLTKLLAQLGLWAGWDVNDEHEAGWFLKRNDIMLEMAGGNWSHPQPFSDMLHNHDVRSGLADMLRSDMHSMRFINFTGPVNFVRNANRPPQIWGWKDPRNTFTLPLWLDLFPNAKIIHIYRNGIDVAQSLVTREQRRVNRLSESSTTVDRITAQVGQRRKQGSLLYLYRKWQSLTDHFKLKERYRKFNYNPCYTLPAAFDLWQMYLQQAENMVSIYGNQSLQICYERFLQNPVSYLHEVSAFCGLQPGMELIKRVAGGVRGGRRYAFVNNPETLNFYDRVKDNYLLKNWGYEEYEIFAESEVGIGDI